MKRFYFGVALLLILLAVALGAAAGLEKIHGEIALELEQAAQAVEAGNLAAAEPELDRAQALWERYEHLLAAFADHEPLEEMEGLFAEVAIYRQAGEQTDLAVACTRLAILSRSVAESHSLKWWMMF